MRSIHSILIPVDFSVNTSIALAKVFELFPPGHSATLHLYHVQTIKADGALHLLSSFFAGYTRQQINADVREARMRLEQMKQKIAGQRPDLDVLCWVGIGEPVQASIAKRAMQLNTDLIIIGKHRHHALFPFLNTIVPGKLAFHSNKPVLTVKPGAVRQDIRTVVIPVGEQFPERKLSILEALPVSPSLVIRLVSVETKQAIKDLSKQPVFETFRAFKSKYACHVSYESITGKNPARALLNYCERVDADVLIVYPGTETRSGWFNRQLSDLLPPGSRTQVLAVMP